MGYVRTVDNGDEPISVKQMQEHLRIDSDTDINTVNDMLKVARQYIEEYTNLALSAQTYKLELDEFPSGEIELYYGPVQAITSIKYYDTSDVQQTLDSSLYRTDLTSKKARIQSTDSWPSTKSRVNAVEVIFTTGYQTPDSVPSPIKGAIKLLVSHFYENRQEEVIMQGGSLTSLEFGYKNLIAPYKIW